MIKLCYLAIVLLVAAGGVEVWNLVQVWLARNDRFYGPLSPPKTDPVDLTPYLPRERWLSYRKQDPRQQAQTPRSPQIREPAPEKRLGPL